VVGVVENMSSFTCGHGESYALFGTGGGQALADDIGVPLLGQIPLESAVATGGDAGLPVTLAESPGQAGIAFNAVAARLDEVVPVTSNDSPDSPDMAGCSARMLAAVAEALDA